MAVLHRNGHQISSMDVQPGGQSFARAARARGAPAAFEARATTFSRRQSNCLGQVGEASNWRSAVCWAQSGHAANLKRLGFPDRAPEAAMEASAERRCSSSSPRA